MQSLSRPLQAMLFALGAYQLWVAHDTLVKVGRHGMPVWQIGLIACLTSLALLLGWTLVRHEWKHLRMKHPRNVALYAAFCVLNNAFYFVTVTHLPLGDFYAIGYLNPLLVAIMGTLFFHEKVPPALWTALLVAFIGINIAMFWGMRDDSTGNATSWFGIALGLINIAIFSFRQLLLRKICPHETKHVLGVYPNILTLAFWLLAQTVMGGTWATEPEYIGTVAMGAACALMGGMCAISALRRAANTATVSAFLYTQMPTGAFLGWLLFDQGVHPATLFGAGIITIAGLFLLWSETRAKKRAAL